MGASAYLGVVSNPTRDDLERLANRLALLASGDGEADNAGRAVGQMARRLGLSGGDLKQMFLAGASAPAPKPTERGDTLTLRKEIRDLEAALRQALGERDAARAELTNLKIGQYNTKAVQRGRLALFAASVPIGVLIVVGVAMFGPDLSISRGQPESRPAITAGSSGTVRGKATLLYREPDRVSKVLGTLAPGSQVSVRRLVWNLMSQWAEVESSAGTGYVAVTDIELR